MKNLTFLHKAALMCILFGGLMMAHAQNLRVEQAQLSTGWTRLLNSGDRVAFPAAATGASSFSFVLTNTGLSTLELTGAPSVQLSGANASEFSVVQPGMTSLNPGESTNFTVNYLPVSGNLSQATLQIDSNDAGSPLVLTLEGAAFDLYGPVYPVPAGTYTADLSDGSNGSFGRAGGGNLRISGVSMGEDTALYWGPQLSIDGDLGIKVSMNDDGNYQGAEHLTFSAASSDLPNGKVVWTGSTSIQSGITGGFTPVMIRATMTATWFNGFGYTPIALIDPATLGMSSQIGGLVQFDQLTDYLQANILIEASTNGGVSWTPYLSFYDSYPTPPGPLPGAGIGKAYSSFSHGFYWKNMRPALSANSTLLVDEGSSAVITSAFINARDLEDITKAYASASDMQFEIVTNNGGLPTSFGHGTITLNGVPLSQGSTFTLQDILDGLLSFNHDGSETTYDEMLFSLKDSKGLLADDGGGSTYNFRININPVNDPPVAQDLTFTSSYAAPLNENLQATDADSSVLTYSIVGNPSNGTISLDPVTGAFVYTPTLGAPGTDSFTYQVSDGSALSNLATVTINLINLPPTSQDEQFVTMEDQPLSGTLSGNDPEGKDLSFTLDTPAANGTVSINADGSFQYQPNTARFGYDAFLFSLTDADGNTSNPYKVEINIIPRIDPGDVLVADQTSIRLYDPVTVQDTIITRNQGLSDPLNLVYKKNVGLFIYDKGTGLIRVDPVTGTQSLVSPASSFSNAPPLEGPGAMTINSANKIIMADPTGILEVDPVSGVVTTLYSGGFLSIPTGVAFLSNGDLLVTDAGLIAGGSSNLIRIATDGTQTVVSTGNIMLLPLDLAVIDDNTVVISDAGGFAGASDNIYTINLSTGVQTLLSTGGNLSIPSGLDFWQGTVFVVNKEGSRQVLKIDQATGTQSILPGNTLENPWGLFVVRNTIEIQELMVNDASCPGAADGSISFNLDGGQSPYTYSLNGDSPVNIGTLPVSIPGLEAGSYVLKITDANGEETQITVMVNATPDTEVPVITAPEDLSLDTDPDSCERAAVALGIAVSSDNCGGVVVTNDAPAVFPVGVTTVTWTATDASGNTATDVQLVTITDRQLPLITAPADVQVNTDAGACEATGVVLGNPLASDNCTLAAVTNDAPAMFPIGTTQVTWTATDASGNSATAVQQVTVVDTELPVIQAPANLTTDPDPGACTASGLQLGNPVASDNCGGFVVSNDAPSVFPQGQTTVTWTVTDASGNTAMATQVITVNAPAAPAVPSSQTYCEGALVGALDTAGFNVAWYDSETSMTPLSTGAMLSTGIYYAAQVSGACESPERTAVNVQVNTVSAPAGSASQDFCGGAVVADLNASGSNIAWYASADGTAALNQQTLLEDNKVYYATQTDPVTGCESYQRLAVTVRVNEVAVPQGPAVFTFCSEEQPAVAALLVEYPEVNWYANASRTTLLSADDPLYDGDVLYGAGYDPVTGCESTEMLRVDIRVVECKVEIFNYLTPDNNDQNEALVITNIEQFPDNHLDIFNRQGERVYSVKGYGQQNRYFTGTSNKGLGAKLPTGTYYYVLEYFSSITGKYEMKKGFLYINNND